MNRFKDSIDELTKAVKEMMDIQDKLQTELLDAYIEINRLQHRVKELEDDGK